MRSLAIPALLLLLGNVSPAAAEASRAASLAAVLPDDCPLYTDVDDDLEDMGVADADVPETGTGDARLLTMVEWGFTGAIEAPEGFGLYLYLYDPQARDWSRSGTVTMAFADEGEGFYENSFSSFRMDLLGASDDGTVTKWSVADADRAYGLVDSECRKYLVGSLTLDFRGDGFSFPVGQEWTWTGLPRIGLSPSTLAASKSGMQVVRSEVYPFTSDAGGISGSQTRYGWQFANQAPFRSDLGLFSVAFTLPSWASDFGELESVHYEYYKYRTDWIYSFKDDSDWEDLKPHVGREALGDDGEYSSDVPDFGFLWLSLLDMDDIDVTTDEDGLVDGHQPYTRFYNNRADGGHHELRVDNPKWAFKLSDEEWEEGRRYTSGELLDYAGSYLGDGDPSGDLPVLNGTVSDELFYVPAYSEDALFRKYGHVENSISRSDILSATVAGMLDSRLDQPFEWTIGIRIPGWGSSTSKLMSLFFQLWILGPWAGSLFFDGQDDVEGFADLELSGKYKALWDNADPDRYAALMDGSVPLLRSWSDDDPVVRYADEEYAAGLESFVQSQDGDVYRLTYDASMSNSYNCFAGSSGQIDAMWTDQTVQASKTDAVFDFRFVDFTFRDGTKTYVLPAASDPFDIIDNVDTNPNPSTGIPRWAMILIVCVVALLALGALAVFFPFIRLILRGLLYVVQFAVDVVYVVLVWWWLALIRKARGEEIPPLWIFGK